MTMLRTFIKKTRPEKGQVLVLSVLLLPLVLGILALIIEAGNLYVHYQELQHAADIAVVTGDAAKAKAVALKNNNIKNSFTIETFKYIDTNNFYIRLKKEVPTFFIKVFTEKKFELNAYAAASKDPKKLIPFPTDPTKIEWEIVQ